MKQRLDNQYGQIASIMQVPVSTDSTPVIQTKSNVLFNGDTYVGRYTEKNKGYPSSTTNRRVFNATEKDSTN